MWAGPLFEGHVCSLGYEVLDWIHAYECHGPGDVQGEALDYDDEMRDFVIEVYRIDKCAVGPGLIYVRAVQQLNNLRER